MSDDTVTEDGVEERLRVWLAAMAEAGWTDIEIDRFWGTPNGLSWVWDHPMAGTAAFDLSAFRAMILCGDADQRCWECFHADINDSESPDAGTCEHEQVWV